MSESWQGGEMQCSVAAGENETALGALADDEEREPLIDATQEVFYNIANLPDAEADASVDWPRRMIYRIFLRSPYPPALLRTGRWHTLHLGLVNEMSLFPQSAIDKGTPFRCFLEVVSVDRQQPIDNDALEVEIGPLDARDAPWAGLDGITWPGFSGGRGALTFCLTSKKTCHLPQRVLLKVGTVRGEVEDCLRVMPLVFGPFELGTGDRDVEDLTGEEMLYFHRQLSLPAPSQGAVLIRESPEIAIPGKIWDSALFAAPVALDLLGGITSDDGPHILDLSSGTGVCGIWIAAALAARARQQTMRTTTSRVTLSDLEEAIGIMEANIALNRHHLSDGVPVSTRILRWGNAEDLIGLGVVHLVVACDLIYEADQLPILFHTLVALSAEGKTSILIGYKQRGLSAAEKQHLWDTFEGDFRVTKLDPVLGVMANACLSSFVGVELWKLEKL